MYREDGKLAARGRHVKHLPMGRMWDLAATPLLFPLARKWTDWQHVKWLSDMERTKARQETYSRARGRGLMHLSCRKWCFAFFHVRDVEPWVEIMF